MCVAHLNFMVLFDARISPSHAPFPGRMIHVLQQENSHILYILRTCVVAHFPDFTIPHTVCQYEKPDNPNLGDASHRIITSRLPYTTNPQQMFCFTPPPLASLRSHRSPPRASLKLLDTTLRDGLPNPDKLTPAQHTRLLSSLHQLCPDIIEVKHLPSALPLSASHPVHSALASPTFRSIDHAASVVARAPRRLVHVYTAAPAAPLSAEKRRVVNHVRDVVTHASGVCENVQYSPKHGVQLFRTDASVLSEMIVAAVNSGASIVTLTDTSGSANPRLIEQAVKHVSNLLAGIGESEHVMLSVHAHGERSEVLRNVVSAVNAGADIVECTVSGVGHMPALQDVAGVFKERVAVRQEFMKDCVECFTDCFDAL